MSICAAPLHTHAHTPFALCYFRSTAAPQDTRMKVKGSAAGGTVTLRQHVPQGKWALVPNPVVEYSRTLGALGGEGKLSGSWDFLNRGGTLHQASAERCREQQLAGGGRGLRAGR